MLIGEYAHTIDTKGRLIFPAKLRESLGEQFVLTKGFSDPCLYVYSMEEWGRIEERIKQLPMSRDVYKRQACLRLRACGRKNSCKLTRICKRGSTWRRTPN